MNNASDFKHLHRLEIKILGEEAVEQPDDLKGSDFVLYKKFVWLAAWFVYDDKKCSAGHLHKQYKTMKHTDLDELMKMLPKEKDNG